ncbi:hypothetical protein QJ857_gp0585 [Tupanvirus soda lake]|uniref:Prolyl 4-hydroxylase alpha subunit Fe(2+) 2OG dioxygenase domain-containing protein n=2 Tax=Tupanvirus TaxID=2094720 RepID=A0A6N1NVP8_9VIRU|nr:hypothetical protein QJ857_gp0585 [Tupanvirus soda lake]QKU35458.1 hypothetical protein [Tupanvirus soda lake]
MNFITSSHLDCQNPIYKEIVNSIACSVQLKNLDFSTSKLYHKDLKENIIDGSQRSSKTHKIYYDENTKIIFQSVEKLIEHINEKQKTLFSLIPNDIDIIKYENGDFFNKHSDFVPIKNKYITYYTLLFCLDANCVGGQTSIYLDDSNSIDFDETIIPNDWLLFMNEIEHAGKTVESGHKIILKANVVHINLSNVLFNHEFDKLVTAKNDIIEKFVLKSGNILPVYNLADYIFYRNCFKDDSTVVPLQFIEVNTVNVYPNIEIQNVNGFVNKNNNTVQASSKIIWFNIGDCCPIISFEMEDEDNDDEKSNQNRVNECFKSVIKNKNLNEIERSISIMICLFWVSALYFNENEDSPFSEIPTNKEDIEELICEKIEENLGKIQKQELDAFSLDKLPNIDLDNITSTFTNEYINKIINSFISETIHYHTGGAYYCNENDYAEVETKIYFGFVKI